MPKLVSNRTFRYELPFPPSVNTYWRSMTRGRRQIVYVSAEGKKFRKQVMATVTRKANSTSRLSVLVELLMPDERIRDIDNYQKAMLDALKHARVYQDDCLIDDLHVKRIGLDPMRIGKCTITIAEL